MKRIPLALFAALCFSSCSVEYSNYKCDHDKTQVSNNEVPSAQPVRRTREIIWEEPKVTRVRVEPIRTTRVSFPTTSVVRTYNYTPPVVYRSYSYSTNYTPVVRANCVPVVRTNCSPAIQMQVRSGRYQMSVGNYTPSIQVPRRAAVQYYRRHTHY